MLQLATWLVLSPLHKRAAGYLVATKAALSLRGIRSSADICIGLTQSMNPRLDPNNNLQRPRVLFATGSLRRDTRHSKFKYPVPQRQNFDSLQISSTFSKRAQILSTMRTRVHVVAIRIIKPIVEDTLIFTCVKRKRIENVCRYSFAVSRISKDFSFEFAAAPRRLTLSR